MVWGVWVRPHVAYHVVSYLLQILYLSLDQFLAQYHWLSVQLFISLLLLLCILLLFLLLEMLKLASHIENDFMCWWFSWQKFEIFVNTGWATILTSSLVLDSFARNILRFNMLSSISYFVAVAHIVSLFDLIFLNMALNLLNSCQGSPFISLVLIDTLLWGELRVNHISIDFI